MLYDTRLTPAPGEVWRHFKGNLYKIICIAQNTEDVSDKRVIYHRLDGTDQTVYDRALSMFMSETDRKKYPLEKFPEYTQKYRFMRVNENGSVRES